MIATCEKCGKKHEIDPEKIEGEVARFKCTSCGQIITVSKSRVKPSIPSPPKVKAPKLPRLHLGRFGLRSKMAILFLFIPLILMGIATLIYLRQMDDLASLTIKENSRIITQFSENAIVENARSTASQVRLYLQTRPNLRKEDFSKDMEFVRIGIQKVGLTGYTCVYSIPDEQGISSLWVHPNEKLIGINLPDAMKKSLGNEFHRWWKVYEGAYRGNESQGYYSWRDADGQIREKFMVCTPVGGTNYVVASTTYLDEFTLPMINLEKRIERLKVISRDTSIGALITALFLVALIVIWYGYRLTKKIRSLTDVAERISIGELETEIEIKSKDEIGELSNAISRMQDSIRLSIERLRKRKA
jgi:HAMP domain-containing protein